MRALLLAASLAFAVIAPNGALAQKYPDKPVRMIVPFPPGGSIDVIARAVAQKFQENTGQPMVVDNRGGAAGLIGGDAVAKAPGDGYTLLLASAGQVTIAPYLYEKLAYDPLNDLVPVTYLVETPVVLFINANSPVQNLQELVALARAKPGEISVGSTGSGSVTHLALELFAQRYGLKFIHVPYKGAAPALNDLAAGTVQLMFTVLPSAKAMLDTGRVRALAIASSRRTATMPNLPTFTEAGFPGANVGVWVGVMSTKGTPAPVISQLNSELNKVMAAPDIVQRMNGLGADVINTGSVPFGAMLKEDAATWQRVIRTGNIKPD